MIKRFARTPGPYFIKLYYYLAGLYFDFIQKRYKYGDLSFIVPSEFTTRVDRGYFALGAYEKSECDIVKKFVGKDSNVIELGGCIGVVACVTNRILARPMNHIVVEANPSLIPYITINRENNRCQFKIENCAVSFDNEVEFYHGQSMVLGSLCEGAGQCVKVKGLSFSDIESKHALQFDTVIMDIEGGEFKLIMENTGFFSRMKNVILENHPGILGAEKVIEYESTLRRAGFNKACHVGQVVAWQMAKE